MGCRHRDNLFVFGSPNTDVDMKFNDRGFNYVAPPPQELNCGVKLTWEKLLNNWKSCCKLK